MVLRRAADVTNTVCDTPRDQVEAIRARPESSDQFYSLRQGATLPPCKRRQVAHRNPPLCAVTKGLTREHLQFNYVWRSFRITVEACQNLLERMSVRMTGS